jgi:hypothetical protein
MKKFLIGLTFALTAGVLAAGSARAEWHGQPGSKAYRAWQSDPRSRGAAQTPPLFVVGVWGAPGMTSTPRITGAEFGVGRRVHSIAGDFTVGGANQVLAIRRY